MASASNVGISISRRRRAMADSQPLHYSALSTYWECPRRWWYEAQGWRPYLLPDPMLRGYLVDQGVAAAWRGGDLRGAITEKVVEQLDTLATARLKAEEAQRIKAVGQEALSMAQRYMQVLGKEVQPLLVGVGINLGLVTGTPDCVAMHKGERVLIELKTGQDPNPRMYSMTGQADFYAYLLGDIKLVYYDMVSPTSVNRYQRPPREDRGKYLFDTLTTFAMNLEAGALLTKEQPRYGWWCARCPFLEACQTHDDWGDDEEVLLCTMWREEGKG